MNKEPHVEVDIISCEFSPCAGSCESAYKLTEYNTDRYSCSYKYRHDDVYNINFYGVYSGLRK